MKLNYEFKLFSDCEKVAETPILRAFQTFDVCYNRLTKEAGFHKGGQTFADHK